MDGDPSFVAYGPSRHDAVAAKSLLNFLGVLFSATSPSFVTVPSPMQFAKSLELHDPLQLDTEVVIGSTQGQVLQDWES